MVQNLWWAAGYNIFAIPLAAGILYNYGVVVSPAIGALLMSMSTVIVAANSQTLRRYEPEGVELLEEYVIRDPVCGMVIEPSQAYSKIEHEGRVVYFRSEKCEREFKENPKKYLSKIGKEEPTEHHH